MVRDEHGAGGVEVEDLGACRSEDGSGVDLALAVGLAEVAAGTANLASAVRGMNALLGPALGVSVRGVAIPDGRLRRSSSARRARPSEVDIVRAWRAALATGSAPAPAPVPSGFLVPLAVPTRVDGVVRLDTGGRREVIAREVMQVIGAGCAAVVDRARLRRSLIERRRQLAAAGERARVADELHGQLRELLAAAVGDHAAETGSAGQAAASKQLQRVATVVAEAEQQLHHGTTALELLEAGQHDDVPTAMRALARRFREATGTMCRVRVEGRQRRLRTDLSSLLFEIAYEVLVNVHHTGRADAVTVRLAYEPGTVHLDVRDDGAGLAHRQLFHHGPGRRGLARLRAGVAEAGGRLTLHDAHPRGLLVEATVPTDRRRGVERGGRR